MHVYKADADEHQINFAKLTEHMNNMTKEKNPLRRKARKLYVEIKKLVNQKVKYAKEIEKLRDLGSSKVLIQYKIFISDCLCFRYF